MEILNYFGWLPDIACNKLLNTLCTFDTESSKPQKNLEDYMSEMANRSTEDKAHLYNEFMEAQIKQAVTKKYDSKFPSNELKSGFQITLVTCNNKNIGCWKL